jgi:hypothetical protein
MTKQSPSPTAFGGAASYYIGPSGAGKSAFLEGPVARDLAESPGFAFVDKHGDSAKRMTDSSLSPLSGRTA